MNGGDIATRTDAAAWLYIAHSSSYRCRLCRQESMRHRIQPLRFRHYGALILLVLDFTSLSCPPLEYCREQAQIAVRKKLDHAINWIVISSQPLEMHGVIEDIKIAPTGKALLIHKPAFFCLLSDTIYPTLRSKTPLAFFNIPNGSFTQPGAIPCILLLPIQMHTSR